MKNVNRRDFLKLAGSSIIGVTVGGAALRAHASDLPKVDPADPQAAALQYTHESKMEGKYCNNCVYIQGDVSGKEWFPCPLFPGKQVAAKGWCAAWQPKP
jgi:hypothetical protein